MLFNSYVFLLLFLPITLAGFAVTIRHSQWLAETWLTGASLFFYGWWNPAYLWLIIGSAAFNYAVGRLLFASRKEGWRRALLFIGVGGNLLLLGYFKYANFFVDSVNAVVGSSFFLDHIVLPLAISFFTFTQIVFLLEVAKDRTSFYSFLDYIFFVTFFPHLIAGPIVRHWEIMPQLRQGRLGWRARDFNLGLTLLILGLAKKLLLADPAGDCATPLFQAAATGGGFSSLEAWVGVLGYAFQIYFDFSAYSDMAIGLARMFGIVFPPNFHSPYKANSIVEFWRHWHMTLTRFITEYVYYPLGGNRCHPIRRTCNVLASMTVSGFWHGANWTFVFWGFLHGVFISINQWWRSVPLSQRVPRGPAMVIGYALTLLCVVAGWVFFRADTLAHGADILGRMLTFSDFSYPMASPLGALLQRTGAHGVPDDLGICDLKTAALLGGWWLITLAGPNTQQLLARYEATLARTEAGRWSISLNYASAVVFGLLLAICLLSINRVMAFLYYRF